MIHSKYIRYSPQLKHLPLWLKLWRLVFLAPEVLDSIPSDSHNGYYQISILEDQDHSSSEQKPKLLLFLWKESQILLLWVKFVLYLRLPSQLCWLGVLKKKKNHTPNQYVYVSKSSSADTVIQAKNCFCWYSLFCLGYKPTYPFYCRQDMRYASPAWQNYINIRILFYTKKQLLHAAHY